MSTVANVDYPNKRIYLSAATMNTDIDTLAVYRDVRELRRLTEAHRRYRPMIVQGGNIEKVAGVSATQAYVQLLYGCRLVPYNANHHLRVIRDTFTDDGYAGRDCFDRAPLSAGVVVDIDVDVSPVEIRLVNSSGVDITAEDLVESVLVALNATTIPVNVEKINDTQLAGSGVPGDAWRPV